MKIVITALAVGVIMTIFFASAKKRYDREAVNIVVDVLSFLFECAPRAGYKSGIDYIVKKKGEKYTVYLLGRIYTWLNNSKNAKEQEAEHLKKAVEAYLQMALASDIREYKKQKKETEKKA